MDSDLVRALRSRGIDVLTAADAGMIRRADEDHLHWATVQGRVLYSFNVADFHEIHTEWMAAEILEHVPAWIDLMDGNGRIIDLKTAARKPSGIESDYRFRIATYAQLMPGASGEARLDTLVKTKTPAQVTQNLRVTQQDVLATTKLYPLAQQSMIPAQRQ
jgi:PAS domain-containing protein